MGSCVCLPRLTMNYWLGLGDVSGGKTSSARRSAFRLLAKVVKHIYNAKKYGIIGVNP